MGRVYVSANGMAQTVEPDSEIDRRLARSKRWRLVDLAEAVVADDRCRPMLMSDGSMGGCDLPLGHEGLHEYTPPEGASLPVPVGEVEADLSALDEPED